VKTSRYPVRGDLYYDEATHLWVDRLAAGRARVGLDPLEAETSGDIVAISFVPAGTPVARGAPLGSLEAAKFVGPLIAPVSGVVGAHNEAVLAAPGLINRDPFAAWLVEIALSDEPELGALVTGEAAVRAWRERELERYRRKGAIAQ
jgi:glycine cleavage system H protein